MKILFAWLKSWRPDILKLPKEKRLALWDRLVNDAFFEDIRKNGIVQAEARMKEWIIPRSRRCAVTGSIFISRC